MVLELEDWEFSCLVVILLVGQLAYQALPIDEITVSVPPSWAAEFLSKSHSQHKKVLNEAPEPVF